MTVTRVKTWGTETLTHADLNAEFDNILNYLNGAMQATSIAIGGASIGSNALAVTGTVQFNSAVTCAGAVSMNGAATVQLAADTVTIAPAISGTINHMSIGASLASTGNFTSVSVNSTQVVGARDTGWAAMTGSADKATVYATGSVTLAQLAGRVMELQAILTTHGLIGA